MDSFLSANTAVNLLPWREIRFRKQRRLFLLLLIFCLSCTLVVWAMMQWQQRQVVDREAQRIQSLQQQWSSLNQTLQKKQMQEAKYDFINAAISRHHSVLAMLVLIAQQLPDNVYLSQIETDGHTMTLWGNAFTHADIALFLQQMDQLSPQKHARLSETNHINAKNSALTFQVTYDLKEFIHARRPGMDAGIQTTRR